MYVHIGEYLNWWGPYQIAKLLQKVGVSEERCDKIGGYLNTTWLKYFCQWLHDKRKRKIRVDIHTYDTWSMDATLAIIILPMLKQLKATKHGAPCTDNEDVPPYLQSESDNFSTSPTHFDKWEYILGEMIWAFEQIQPDNDWEAIYHKDGFNSEGYKIHSARINRGTTLFGKYYQALWD